MLVFLVDTLRADHLDPFGYERSTAPHLAAFARDAVTFERAYAPSSWTKPSTASLLTGLDPLEHGAITGSDRIDPEVGVLADLLQRRGYATAGISANPNVDPAWGFDRGFERFRDRPPATRAGDFLDLLFSEGLLERGERPSFLYLHTIDPHQPYRPPDPGRNPWPYDPGLVRSPSQINAAPDAEEVAATIDAYDGEIAYSDRIFGRLLDELRARGRYEEMLIVYVSDHGEEFLDHGRAGHQQTLYEEVVRVPLLVKFPGNDLAGRRVSAPASLLDVVPTILAAAGADPSAALQGLDLRRLASGAPPGERTLFFDLDREGKGDASFRVQAVRKGRYKLIRSSSPRERVELYDLEADPREQDDLSARSPEVVAQLGGLLDEWSLRAAQGFHLVVANEPDRTDRRFRGRLRTDGRFVDVLGRGLEEGDRIELDEGARSFAFDFTTHNRPNTAWPPPAFLVDQDALSFRLEPEDAALEVLAFEAEGCAEPALVLGGERRAASRLPLVLSAAQAELDVSAGALRACTGTDPRGQLRGQACLMRVRQAPASAADEELQEHLRALGY